MGLRIDQTTCTGCGLCPAICPGAFAMNERGDAATVIDEAADGPEVEEAIQSCPSQSIGRD